MRDEEDAAGDRAGRTAWLQVAALAVVFAGGLVWLTASRWPDLIAGAVLAVVFLQSAWSIIRQSQAELRAAR